MTLSLRLILLATVLVLGLLLPESAMLQSASAEGVGMTTAEFDEGGGSWAVWIGAAVIGVFGLALVFLIRRFSLGSRQRPIDTDKSAADNQDR
ncbi:MAG: hypothetical protein ACXIUL_00470 [Wenzhouxiangella sp.]